jgi:hypothetical protein
MTASFISILVLKVLVNGQTTSHQLISIKVHQMQQFDVCFGHYWPSAEGKANTTKETL